MRHFWAERRRAFASMRPGAPLETRNKKTAAAR